MLNFTKRITPMDNGYQLSRSWFDFCFENPEIISPNHTAIYFFAIEHCNRLGWKEKFGFPTQMTMDAIGIKKHQTYIKYFNDLVDWGFLKLVQKSTNQYSANIISLKSAKPKSGKALDKAFITHAAKQTEPIGQSTGQSNSSIYKQQTINHLTKEQIEQQTSVVADATVCVWPSFEDFWNRYDKKKGKPKSLALWKKISQGAREKIMQHLDEYCKVEKRYRKDPERYLKNQGWEDEVILNPANNGTGNFKDKRTEHIESLLDDFNNRNNTGS